MRCDNILVVANIARAITDQSLKSSLYKVLSRHVPLEWEESGGKGLNVGVVCTRSEVTRPLVHFQTQAIADATQNINLRAAKTAFCGPGKPIAKDVMDRFDNDIALAERANDKQRKKELKRR